MRIYHSNPKHEGAGQLGRKGTRLDLSPAQAAQLLNDPTHCLPVEGKRQLVGARLGRIYVFQEDAAGGYHAYPATGNEVFTKFPTVALRIAALLGTDIKRLSRMRE